MRVLTIGNLYPPHHFGGYESIWKAAVDHLRSHGHEVRVLATDYRHVGVDDGGDSDVRRELDWYWRDHDFVRFSLRDRVRLERRNHAVLARNLKELRPDVVSFWSMGGMSHSLIEDVRLRGFPIVFFVFDEWFDYGRSTDQWSRIFRLPGSRIPALVTRSFTGIP
ncbi:MAG: glycosyltransferase, partial [Solirubrobacteraceae bacterium]